MRTGAFRYGAILASALVCALYARVDLPWAVLGWVALVPWLSALERERTVGAAIGNGTAMSMAFTVAVFAWFASAASRYASLSPLLTYPLLTLAAPLLQPQFLTFAAVRHGLSRRGVPAAIVRVAAACTWVGTEWLCPRLLGDTVGQGLYPFATVRQAADLAGATGLTFVLLLVNESVWAALRAWRHGAHRALREIAAALTMIGALAGYGVLRQHQLAQTAPAPTPLTAALVQASLDDYDGLRARVGTAEAVRQILDAHTSLSRQALIAGTAASRIHLLVWPETVYPTTFGTPRSAPGAAFDAEIVRFVEDTGIPLVFGTYARTGDLEHNAAVLLQPRAHATPARAVYHKRQLFPLTEEVPPWLESAFLREYLPWLGTWRAGGGPPLLTMHRADAADLHVAPLICLDAVDPRLALDAARRGADLILTLSNDGWFADGRGARLHLVVSAFRSIETRLPQLRATNTGISAVIDASGAVVARTAVGERLALTASVLPGRRGRTVLVRWGDWFGPASCLVAIALAALALRGRRRDGAPPGARPSGAPSPWR